jgi:hypothetical protein
MNFTIGLLLLAFTGATEIGKATESLSTPQSIIAALATRDCRAVVNELWTSDSWDKHVSPGIKGADAKWLDIAERVRTCTDAGASEDLDDALAEALLKAPYQVLPILKRLWWIDGARACRFGVDSELPGGVASYLNRLERVLQVTPPKNVASLRNECMVGIRETHAELRKAAN